jgi:hypothetical protein
MAENVAAEIIRHLGLLMSQQANFRRYWEEIAYYVMPPHATFLVQPMEGLKRTERLFDETAVSANERFAAAIEQMLTPRSQEWHGMSSRHPQLAGNQKVEAFFEQFTQVLFALRYRPKANFASQTHECYMSLGAFGNMALFIDEELGSGIRYRTIPMQELAWAQDHQGRVDTVYRNFKLQGRQVVQMFPDNVPKSVADTNKTNPYAEHEIVHAVRPNKNREEGRRDARGMAYESIYICKTDQVIIAQGGYRTFPYAIGRYSMAPRENYGRGPAMACFAAIRTLNEEKKTILRAGQKVVDPPILVHEEGVLEAFNQRAGAVNYGMLTSDGEELAKPFVTGANIPLGLELMKLEMSAVNDAFLTSLFQILVESPNMTATEALIRAQEKGTMLAPTMGRQQSEFLGPLIEREIDLIYNSPSLRQMLPPIPPELLELGGYFDIEYKSPLTKSMRASEGTAIMQTVQSVGVLANIDPSVTDLFDFDKTAKRLAEINGFPADCYKTDDELAAARDAREKQQAAQAITAAAPQLSLAAKNLGQAKQAEAVASSTGAPAALNQPADAA